MCDVDPLSANALSGALWADAPQSIDDAVRMVTAGFGWLANADLAGVPATARAECLRQLERARSVQTAAHAAVLAAFDHDACYADDGQGTSRTWLRWQTQITSGAAAGAVGWMRRLRAHPAIADGLRAGKISESWAKQICEWSDLLPESARADADVILLAAAAGGAELADLAKLVEQMRATLAGPDRDRLDDGFDQRRLRLATTIGGAGKLDGDLTPECAAAVQAVLDALAKKAGPEDTRTAGQRRHDALEEACRRLIASGCVPDRVGQPTRIQLHIGLEELARRLVGTSGDGVTPPPVQVPWSAAGPGYECDATIVPEVTGRVDFDLLDKLTTQLKNATPWSQRPAYNPASTDRDQTARDTIRDLILANAVALLSGPDGLASVLRTGTLPPPAASISLPLDIGAATDTIPPHLRRAVIARDQHCRGPGCDVPASACHVHHLKPRSQGGPTSIGNLALYCAFHHLIMIHQWGWTATLNPDGTITTRSPHGRVLHSHSPPPGTAA